MAGDSLTLRSERHGFEASVSFDRWDGERALYSWRIAAIGTDGIEAEATDLRLGAGQLSDAKALRSLLEFFGAWSEAIAYSTGGRESDNLDLFPEALLPLGQALGSDELTMLADETFGPEDGEV